MRRGRSYSKNRGRNAAPRRFNSHLECPRNLAQILTVRRYLAGQGLGFAARGAWPSSTSLPYLICSPLQARREPALSDEKSLWLCTVLDLYAFSRAGQQIPGHRQLIGRVAQVFGALDVKSLVQADAFVVPESVRTQCPFFRPTTASATSIENDQRLLSALCVPRPLCGTFPQITHDHHFENAQ